MRSHAFRSERGPGGDRYLATLRNWSGTVPFTIMAERPAAERLDRADLVLCLTLSADRNQPLVESVAGIDLVVWCEVIMGGGEEIFWFGRQNSACCDSSKAVWI